MMQTPDADNKLFNLAADFVKKTNRPIFLTGKAGTGKTTFLKYIKSNRFKNTVVVAPTGVAAINAGGTTIHSFFGLPFSPFIPQQQKGLWNNSESMDENALVARLKINQEKKDLMQSLELLIIDEISMVRCDVLDAIDVVLRHVRNNFKKAFGGVQVLYIGDMYQLPPVVKKDEWQILSHYYESPFFFNSKVCIDNMPVYLELQKIYRQTDEDFIYLLNQVRNNNMDADGYALLNSRLNTDDTIPEHVITLTTHNNKADAINDRALANITTPEYNYKAIIDGEFYESSYPAETTLRLKEGAQVMFLKNDAGRRFYNGKIGTVSEIAGDKITVVCNENGLEEKIEVGRETWKTIRYTLNQKQNQVDEEDVGSFTQFPLRLAWAITIHKSQGLTFQHAIIDAEQAFAPGQVYVALSRCTSLAGLTLKTRISPQGLFSNETIVSFSEGQKKKSQYEDLVASSSVAYEYELILDFFTMDKMMNAGMALSHFSEKEFTSDKFKLWQRNLDNMLHNLHIVAAKFVNQIEALMDFSLFPAQNNLITERMQKAGPWFSAEIAQVNDLLLKFPAVTDNRAIAREFTQKSAVLHQLLQDKLYYLPVFSGKFSFDGYIKAKENYKKPAFTLNIYSGRATYVPDDVIHPLLYQQMKELRTTIADENNIPLFMICSTQSLEQMANFLPTKKETLLKISGWGATRVKKYGKQFLDLINAYVDENELAPDENEMAFTPKRAAKSKKPKQDSKLISFQFLKEGKTIEEIASLRGFAVGTIEGHLSHYVATGELSLTDVMKTGRIDIIRRLMKDNPGLSSSELVSISPDLQYSELRFINSAEKFAAFINEKVNND